jgi:hypothetical protein
MPMTRIDWAAVVPATTTCGVSPSGTQETLPVHTWHVGLPATGRHGVLAATAGTAVPASTAAAADTTMIRRRSKISSPPPDTHRMIDGRAPDLRFDGCRNSYATAFLFRPPGGTKIG